MTSRREFLRGTGYLLLYFDMASRSAFAAPGPETVLPPSLADNPALDSWLRIAADGMVDICPGKCELGQGIQTALAQIAAEELDVGLGRIRVMTVDTAHSPDEGYTAGSRSVELSGSALRAVAAEARGILTGLAAEQLGIVAGAIDVRDGAFVRGGVATGLDYWSVVSERTLVRDAGGGTPAKRADQYGVVGLSVPRIDIPPKAFAEAIYIHDMRPDGMLHARVVRTGDPEAVLTLTHGVDAIAEMPGVVRVVRDGSFLAVVARREEQAIDAARSLAKLCLWESKRELPKDPDPAQWLRQRPAEVTVVGERTAADGRKATRTFSSRYTRAFQAHASIAPATAIAERKGSMLTVWSHAQGMHPLRGAIAALVGLDPAQVRCIHVQGSGCYGHNGADDAAADAAVIAMHVAGSPIRVQWMRSDEFLGEPYGSAMVTEVRAGVDSDGTIVDWHYDVWSGTHSSRPAGEQGAGGTLAGRQIAAARPLPPVRNMPQPAGGGDRNAVPLYTFANQRITKHLVKDMPLRVSAMRSLGAYANVFSIESFMDEVAGEIGVDAIEFRIRHLDDPRAVAVLQTLRREMAQSGMEADAPGASVGIGFAKYKNLGAYCAVAMRVLVNSDADGIRLERAIGVVDAGLVVNPDGVINQIEGGIIQASSWTIREQLRFSADGVTSRDWAGYPVLTFPEVPDVRVVIVEPPGAESAGAGEAAQGPTAAAIGNALARATGKRLRDLPLTAARLRQA